MHSGFDAHTELEAPGTISWVGKEGGQSRGRDILALKYYVTVQSWAMFSYPAGMTKEHLLAGPLL